MRKKARYSNFTPSGDSGALDGAILAVIVIGIVYYGFKGLKTLVK